MVVSNPQRPRTGREERRNFKGYRDSSRSASGGQRAAWEERPPRRHAGESGPVVCAGRLGARDDIQSSPRTSAGRRDSRGDYDKDRVGKAMNNTARRPYSDDELQRILDRSPSGPNRDRRADDRDGPASNGKLGIHRDVAKRGGYASDERRGRSRSRQANRRDHERDCQHRDDRQVRQVDTPRPRSTPRKRDEETTKRTRDDSRDRSLRRTRSGSRAPEAGHFRRVSQDSPRQGCGVRQGGCRSESRISGRRDEFEIHRARQRELDSHDCRRRRSISRARRQSEDVGRARGGDSRERVHGKIASSGVPVSGTQDDEGAVCREYGGRDHDGDQGRALPRQSTLTQGCHTERENARRRVADASVCPDGRLANGDCPQENHKEGVREREHTWHEREATVAQPRSTTASSVHDIPQREAGHSDIMSSKDEPRNIGRIRSTEGPTSRHGHDRDNNQSSDRLESVADAASAAMPESNTVASASSESDSDEVEITNVVVAEKKAKKKHKKEKTKEKKKANDKKNKKDKKEKKDRKDAKEVKSNTNQTTSAQDLATATKALLAKPSQSALMEAFSARLSGQRLAGKEKDGEKAMLRMAMRAGIAAQDEARRASRSGLAASSSATTPAISAPASIGPRRTDMSGDW